jgi:HK97 family phage major capsid protein
MPDAADVLLPRSMDDIKGKTPEELNKILKVLDAHLRSLHQTDEGELRELDTAEKEAFDLGVQLRDTIVDRLDEHARIADVFRRKPQAVVQVMDSIRLGLDDPGADFRMLSNGAARDRALKMLDTERHIDLAPDQLDQVDKLIRRDPVIARRVLVTENEAYRSMWMKMVTRPFPNLTQEESRAMEVWEEFRAMGEVGTTTGGYGVPVFVDPSVILTAQGSGNPFLQIARQITISTNKWTGVSSAGVSWAFTTEAGATADSSPTLGQPAITVHMARGFIPYSIEVGTDYPGFANEMQALLAAGYDELLVDKLTRGTGTGEPKGILTAISAVAGDRVALATTSVLTAADPYKVWKALPQRNRRGASWLMNVGVNNAIRQLGTANVFHGYTVNLPESFADQLMGRPVYESPYMPDTTTWTTTAEGQAIVGDFSNYAIVRNGGMSIELVPQLFQQVTAGTGPATPTGQRGWFAYARVGADATNTSAFRLLVCSS